MPILDHLRRPNHRLTPLGWIVLLSLLALVVAGGVWASRTPGGIAVLLAVAVAGAVLRVVIQRRRQP